MAYTNRLWISRRRLLIGGTALGGSTLGRRLPAALAAPAVITSDRERPLIPYGVMSGDPTDGRAIIWSKTDRPARMLVEYSTPNFKSVRQQNVRVCAHAAGNPAGATGRSPSLAAKAISRRRPPARYAGCIRSGDRRVDVRDFDKRLHAARAACARLSRC